MSVMRVTMAFLLVFSIDNVYSQLLIKEYSLCGGKGVIRQIRVTPCTKEPCDFKRNSKVYVELIAAFDKPSKTVKLTSIAQVGSTNMTLVGTPTDLCKKDIVKCPVKGKGDFRTATFIVPIKSVYAPNPYNATFIGYGDGDLVELCVRLLIRVID